MSKSKNHLICFDLDGVLISSMITANHIFYDVVQKELRLPIYDYPKDKKLLSLSAEDRMYLLWSTEIKEQGITEVQIEKTLQIYRQKKLEAHMQPCPGAKDAVELMAEHFEYLACVSSNSEQLVQDFLAKMGLLHHFTKITGIDFISQAKPDPQIYISTIDYFGLEPQNCLTFEDSTAGITSATEAGMKVIGVATGLESVEELKRTPADEVWEDLMGINLEKIKEVLGDS